MNATLASPARPAVALCAHCGLPAPASFQFCCAGCEAAFGLVHELGLGRYYRDRSLAPDRRAPRPDDGPVADLESAVIANADGSFELVAAVDGLQCGACVWLIESILGREPCVLQGRINLTTRRLRLVWRGTAHDVGWLGAKVAALGYRLVPYTASSLQLARDATGRRLLHALGVAGFATGNVMLIAIGSWAGERQGMGPATRDLLHVVAALIAVPCIAFAGQPFFVSAWGALSHRRTNMDVPISLGLILVTGLSLWQTTLGGHHTYFESAVMLLFVLLIGRVMDHRARGQARAAAEELLILRTTDVTVFKADGTTARCKQQSIQAGDRLLVGMGERVGADGTVESGLSSIDTSLVTGESLPVPAHVGSAVFAGTLNLGAPLVIRATRGGGGTILAECVRLIEAAESQRGRYVVLADRVARAYAPVVHLAALATFVFWTTAGGASASDSLVAACAVLIVTCPCALALAIPLVQVIATGRMLAGGILLKSPTALERLAGVTTVCFDKTGTLTEPELRLDAMPDPETLDAAAALAAGSRHPLARALCAAAPPTRPMQGLVEHPGEGISCRTASDDGEIRLGSASFCGTEARGGAEMFLARPGRETVRFAFAEHLRDGAATTVASLRRSGLRIRLLSGDRPEAVAAVAGAVGIDEWRAACGPADKVAALRAWALNGETVLMVGDGLNDGPALAAAAASASPASASDLSQTLADVVYQGRSLAPVADVLRMAGRARRVVKQNLVVALGYNAIALPVAMAGLVEPWLAALSMSLSSLLVTINSARVRR